MTHRISFVFSNIRNRSATERRILALTAYAAGASVVVALWAASIRQTLYRAELLATNQAATVSGEAVPPPPPSASGAQRSEEQRSATTGAGEPASPWEAIREAGQTIAESIRAAGQAINETSRRASAPEELSPAAPPAAPPEASSLIRLPELLVPSSAPPPRADTPAATLAGGLKPKSYSTYAAARLLASPIAAARPERDHGGANRTMAILSYNLQELRHTARDIYRYLTGE